MSDAETKTLLGMSQRRERLLDGILTDIADSLGPQARSRIIMEEDVLHEVRSMVAREGARRLHAPVRRGRAGSLTPRSE